MAEIWFSDQIPLDKKKGDQIAKLIADQIQSMSRQNSEAAAWRSSEAEGEERSLSEWVTTRNEAGLNVPCNGSMSSSRPSA